MSCWTSHHPQSDHFIAPAVPHKNQWRPLHTNYKSSLCKHIHTTACVSLSGDERSCVNEWIAEQEKRCMYQLKGTSVQKPVPKPVPKESFQTNFPPWQFKLFSLQNASRNNNAFPTVNANLFFSLLYMKVVYHCMILHASIQHHTIKTKTPTVYYHQPTSTALQWFSEVCAFPSEMSAQLHCIFMGTHFQLR